MSRLEFPLLAENISKVTEHSRLHTLLHKDELHYRNLFHSKNHLEFNALAVKTQIASLYRHFGC
jgi:hypothetical protein